MVFKKKGYIRAKEDNRLLSIIESLKHELVTQQSIVKKSVDPSPAVLAKVKLLEAKYLFLLREARKRNTSM
ncbi:YaaL family protein [Bacillus alkalicellulosilyticus]|uniref:YaaL family protein n=1 Tax=Alkalihalobacterium alkalicellulosilyticum TaxID=1912214 RepID=UPI000995EB00|nr:YaaL family protein [Bacillus alkalicellulosilyticus]